MLRKIFKEFANNWKKIFEELEKLRQRIVNAGKEPTYGLHRKKQMPIFRMLKREIFGEEPAPIPSGAMAAEVSTHEESTKLVRDMTLYGMNEEVRISNLVALTQDLYCNIERELKLIGFWESIPARNKLVADLQKAILQPEFEKMPGLVKNRKHIISRLMEIAEKNNDTILYAN